MKLKDALVDAQEKSKVVKAEQAVEAEKTGFSQRAQDNAPGLPPQPSGESTSSDGKKKRKRKRKKKHGPEIDTGKLQGLLAQAKPNPPHEEN